MIVFGISISPTFVVVQYCNTFWTIVQILNFPVVCQPHIWLMRKLLPGLACRAYA